MFSKTSRYQAIPTVTLTDASGRLLAVKDLRLRPDTPGTFRHTVTGGDRMDQLAYQYYGQPLFWWVICDANPAFLSPLAPLGQEPVVTSRFPLAIDGVPPWGALIGGLRATPGVEAVKVVEDIAVVPTPGGGADGPTFEKVSRAVLVTHNRLTVAAATLADSMAALGFTVAPFVTLDQVGQEIVIPPKPNG